MPKTSQKDELTYEPETIDSELEKDLKKLEKRNFSSLLSQVQSEFTLSYWFMKPKWDEWAIRLKLYNNQRRDKEAVGDPLMFTIHQTVLASLYSDRLQADFRAREQGDEEQSENLNLLSEFDQEAMEKDIFDYWFDWDAGFFGRAVALFMDFDRELMTPLPEVIDPMVFLRDPRATSVRGDRRGKGGLRFGGREIRLSKFDLAERKGLYFNLKGLKTDGTDINSVFDRNAQLRSDAQGMGDISKFDAVGANAEYRMLEWFTRWKGKHVFVTLSGDRSRIVRYQELPDGYFPLLDRSIYPMAHDWDGVSIPDLTEDKQRGRAVVQNLGIGLVKKNLHTRYLFDSNKITNRADLDRDQDKHIAVDGNPAGALVAAPSDGVKQEVQWIMEVLDGAAQRATATPEIQQGAASQEKRTLGEINLVASKVDIRYSLSAKVFGWSEKRFWQQWRALYAQHFKDGIDEKAIRIAGPMGSSWKKLARKDIIGKTDPDIIIESRVVSDAQRLEKLGLFRQLVKDAVELQPQDTNIRYSLRRMGRLSGFTRDEINSVIPLNYDELKAEDENDGLELGKKQEVAATDDHVLHLEIHGKAEDNVAKMAHIEAHKKAMLLKRERPDLFPQPAAQGPEGAGQPKPMNGSQDFRTAAALAAGNRRNTPTPPPMNA